MNVFNPHLPKYEAVKLFEAMVDNSIKCWVAAESIEQADLLLEETFSSNKWIWTFRITNVDELLVRCPSPAILYMKLRQGYNGEAPCVLHQIKV